MFVIIQPKKWNFIGVLFIITAIITGYFTYTNLQKGLIFNDEAYYLFPFKNEGQSLSFDRTNYYRIFKFLYTDYLSEFRARSISLLAVSSFLLMYISSKFFKVKLSGIWLGLLAVTITYLTWKATNIAMEQYMSNPILINFSLVFGLLFALTKKQYWIFVSAFVLAFVLFNGNSHAIVTLPIFLWLCVGIDFSKWKSNIIYFFAGGLVGIIIYFTTMDTLDNYVYQWQFLQEYLSFHGKQHPKIFYVKWLALVLGLVVIPIILFGSILWYFVKYNSKKNKIIDISIIVLSVVGFIFYYYNREVFTHVFILIAHLFVLRYIFSNQPNSNKYLLALWVMLPIGLCFGSMTWFHLRVSIYQIYYFIAIAVVLTTVYKKAFPFFVFTLWVIFLTYKFPNFQYQEGWKNFVFSEQTERIEINNHPHYLDKEKVTKIKALQPYLQNQENVIYSNNKLLGYLYVLDAHPPIHYYFTLKDYIDFILKKKGLTKDEMIYIESKTYPFHSNEIVPLKYVEYPDDYQTITVDEFTLYLPKNYTKK